MLTHVVLLKPKDGISQAEIMTAFLRSRKQKSRFGVGRASTQKNSKIQVVIIL